MDNNGRVAVARDYERESVSVSCLIHPIVPITTMDLSGDQGNFFFVFIMAFELLECLSMCYVCVGYRDSDRDQDKPYYVVIAQQYKIFSFKCTYSTNTNYEMY